MLPAPYHLRNGKATDGDSTTSTERVRLWRAKQRAARPPKPDPNIELFTAWFGSAAVAEMTAASAGRPLVAVLTGIVRQWTLTRVPAPRPKRREPSTRAYPVMREVSLPPATPPPPSPRRVRAPPQAAIDAAVERAEGRGQKK